MRMVANCEEMSYFDLFRLQNVGMFRFVEQDYSYASDFTATVLAVVLHQYPNQQNGLSKMVQMLIYREYPITIY